MKEIKCTRCDICSSNNYEPLAGDGNYNANIMFVGRSPTAFDIKLNVPLVSKDGMLFQRYLDLFNFDRDLIYVTNAIKCKTPNNRYPSDIEIHNCRENLEAEIIRINPKIIVLMGITAIRSYFKLAFIVFPFTMEQLNARYMLYNGRIIIFMVHPSHGLNSIDVRGKIYIAFHVLNTIYKIINPGHSTNINY